ncbi:MAG: DNA gyrase subunit A [Bdellovibrionales bacterium]|nr:DNA gyrase subunit A [Bdellovibrionales bacterium]
MSSTQTEQIVPKSIVEEMRSAYLDYAMSVIVGRALPDVRDGLKPVHRRVLYGMYEMNNVYNKAYKKSARIVGDVMGKYHPHGDTAIYDTIVRMAQDFSLRATLVDGQGNFGSVDGDGAAAMRYTEIRLSKIAQELLYDIEKDTVEFVRNYDDTLDEPALLPSRVPTLLLNGASGIAVGMATNIPPHNLGELCEGLITLIENPETEVKDLMKIIKGPDFPTAGEIFGKKGIADAYETGKGKFTIRARATIEPMKKGDRQQIVVTEIPYQVNKAKLIESIADHVRNKKIEGISDLRDESDRDGMRVVIELKKDCTPAVVLNKLYTMTQMQTSFGVIMLALVNNRPKVLSLRECLDLFIEHRREVVTRRTLFELNKAKARAHILEGLKIALDQLDQVIALIRKSKDPVEAKSGLCKSFALSVIQAQAILDMRLQRLTNLERDKILTEYKEVLALIEKLEEILAKPKLVDQIIKKELAQLKDDFGTKRLTGIRASLKEFSDEDLIEEEEMVVTITHAGYIKRNPLSLYRSQKRGGKGKVGTGIKQEDFVTNVFVTSTHAYLLIFTDKGKCYWVRVHELPQVGRVARGKPIINLVSLSSSEKVAAILPVKEFEAGQHIVMATKNGLIKKTDLMAFANPRSSGIIALGIENDDKLISVHLTGGSSDIFLATKNGQSIRFPEKQVRAMGRGAKGVTGVKLKKDDEVVGMQPLEKDGTILMATEKGYGKRTKLEDYRSQSRGGSGIIAIKVAEKNGAVVGTLQVGQDDDVMLISNKGKLIRTKVKDISVIGRSTQGVRLIHLDKDEKLVSIAKIAAEDEDNEVVGHA